MERWPIMSGKRLIGHLYNISIDFISMEIIIIIAFTHMNLRSPNTQQFRKSVLKRFGTKQCSQN